MRWSEWLYGGRVGPTASPYSLMEFLFDFLTNQLGLDARDVRGSDVGDYQRGGRHDKPNFLRNC